MSLPRLSWNMGEDGVITIYARYDEIRAFDLCDVWRNPAIEKGLMDRQAAIAFQIEAADRICAAWNKDAIDHAWREIDTCPEDTTVAFMGGAARSYSVGRMKRAVKRMDGSIWPSWWGGGWSNDITRDQETWPTHWQAIAPPTRAGSTAAHDGATP